MVRWYDALVRMVFVQGRIFAIDDQECSLWEDTSPAYDVETGAVVGSDGQGNRCKYNNPIKILVSLILGGFIGMVYTCVCFVFMSVVHGPIAFLLIVKGTLMMVYGFPFLILFCPVAIGLAAALAVLWIPYNIVLGLVLGFYTGFISSYLASVECTGISGVFLSLEMMTEHIYTRYTSEVALLTYLSGVFAR